MLIAVVALAAVAAGILLSRNPLRPAGPRPAHRLLVVGLDGADWNILDPLIAAGALPNLARLAHSGVRARLRSAQPMLSPVLWTTIATGVSPERHGIVDFIVLRGDTGEAVPVTSTLRRAPAFWNLLSEASVSVGVTGWWASYPAEQVNGFVISDRVAYQVPLAEGGDAPVAGKVWPPEAWNDVLKETVSPDSLTEEDLRDWIGPAPDDDATTEARDIEREIRTIVASTRTYARGAARLVERYRPDVEALYLQATDTVAHLTMPYRAPTLPGADPRLVARFGGTLDAAYREADRILGEALHRAGDDANVLVLSDHGFRSGSDRPRSSAARIGRGRAADWHRPWGVLILSGPSIKPGATLEDPGLPDIAPTLLALAGVAPPAGLEGRVLAEALRDDIRPGPGAEGTSTLAAGGGPDSPAPGPSEPPAAPAADSDASETHAVLERLVSLGYLSTDSLNARNNRGILALNRGDYHAAIGEFQAALSEEAKQPAILVNLARAEWLAGDAAAARRTLETALALDPRSREALNLAGNVEMSAGNTKAAEERFRRALAFEPDDPDLHNSLGLLFESQERWTDAVAEYRRVVEVDPDYAGGYNNLGNALRRLGRDGEAEEFYRRATTADPSFAGSWNNLALLLQDRGETAEAERLYRRALRLAPRDPRTHNNLASLLFAAGRLDEALSEFREASRLDPLYAEPLNGVGAVLGRMGRVKEELAAYRDALRIRPAYLDARYNLGLALIRQGKEAEGEAELRSVLSSDPTYRDAATALENLRAQRSRSQGREAVKSSGGGAPG